MVYDTSTRQYHKSPNGWGFIDPDHQYYVEIILSRNRKEQGRELRALPKGEE